MFKNITIAILCSLFVVTAFAKSPKQKSVDSHTYYSNSSSPWDFSAMLGLYNSGFGFGGLADYRIMDNLISGPVNSLSAEAGLNYVSYSGTLFTTSYSYSYIEIPMRARWNFTFLDGKLVVGPRVGINFNTAGSYTVNGVNYTGSASGVTFQIGGFGIYKFTENWGARVGIEIGSYTTFSFGANYSL